MLILYVKSALNVYYFMFHSFNNFFQIIVPLGYAAYKPMPKARFPKEEIFF